MATQLYPALNVILISGLHDSCDDHWQSRRRGTVAPAG